MTPNRTHYDAVIVGARPAGAATAMLLARAGLDVLAVDRSSAGSDTLSTHALMRQAVTQLDRWGLIPALQAAGTPAIRRTVFRYPDDEIVIDIKPAGGAEGLYAPRRTVLDPILVSAARAAGAEVHHDTAVHRLVRRADGRVCGVDLTDADGRSRRIGADLVIGADGLRSKVARLVEAPVQRRGAAANAVIMRYVEETGFAEDEYCWLNQPHGIGGIIPTNDGAQCVFTSLPPAALRRGRDDVGALFDAGLAALDPDVAAAVRGARPCGPLRSFPGHVGQFRQATGAGWALVGDAGYFKDPGAAHGISDALRDAELLANAVVDDDLAAYGPTRDRLSAGLFDALEQIADWSWTIDELPGRHLALAKAMAREHAATLELWDRRVAPAAA